MWLYVLVEIRWNRFIRRGSILSRINISLGIDIRVRSYL